MIPLSAHGITHGVTQEILGRISRLPIYGAERGQTIRVLTGAADNEPLDGYLAVLGPSSLNVSGVPGVSGCTTDHLSDGDVVSITPRGQVRTLYRRRSKSNTLFATDRCNSLCVMCSQPPRDVDDSGRASELIRLIELIDPATEELGITGGEPTLLRQGLLDVVAACRDQLHATALHVLSNGRRFYYWKYASALGRVGHPDLMIGVPVYSDIDSEHDYVVQARGAFDETIIGLQNLARAHVPIEIRVVIHHDTYERLPALGEYIYRNLPFAAHVAFMGLEVIGFAKANIRQLWVDPVDYADVLEEAVLMLAASKMNISIYNHQLCTLPPSLWPYTRPSISDWKREYAPECDGCSKVGQCGGFFAWNLSEHRSRAIRPLRMP
jgi:His-Xaa-Ser system radical SAM maturase HxsC